MTSDTVTSGNNMGNAQPNMQQNTVPANTLIQGEGSPHYHQPNLVQPNITTQGEDSPHYHVNGNKTSGTRTTTNNQEIQR